VPKLSVDGTIVSDPLRTVKYTGRPALSAGCGAEVFKLLDDGSAAPRVPVQLGKRLVDVIAILGGLEIGDWIIVSDISQYANAACDRIKQRPGEAIMAANDNGLDNGTALISLRGVQKVFLTDEVETHALSDVHIDIKQGEYVAISGPSGCGKSTLLSILGLLDTPSAGEYTLAGQRVAGLPRVECARVRNRQIGFIFQAFNLIADLSVHDNVELPLTYRDMPAGERGERVMAALERVGMSHRAKHFPAQLSGGEQQRVAVARAVAGDPAILLADEPTGNLDSRNGEAVMALLQELHCNGSTICMVTHDARYVQHADREISLFDGRVVGSGVPTPVA